MPELPEVETVRRGLTKLIVGKQILAVKVCNQKSLQVADTDIDQVITGATVRDVRRRAKMLMVDLDNGNTLLIHLKMTGQMVYRGDENWGGGHPNDSFLGNLPDRSTRVEFDLSGGNQLFFNDQRKFGWIKLVPTSEVEQLEAVAKLGPEPLVGDPAPEFLRRIRRRAKSPIKAAILDQTVIAGVGNIYADESLWLAQINPTTKVGSLTDEDLIRLLKAIQQSMTESLAAGGSTARNYVKADGTRGDYLDKFAAVYKREGQPCKRCGREIEKMRVAGRGTHICPICQKL
ncbi:MAG: bifunctional DNA-formamidopyrimidine glycosylase/DNA-(apurinic or apyrimidinic site) lyase [Candidatus Saccharibacteria bacterium]|nr:bifunctional DNA-formamidopyrimidine glycosylase/DNA-(apurinic or apyrimidinic site) lyase [Candidatus Saccharibacteria bacterium]